MAMENGILSVRNLGQKSAKEIKQLFFEECYTRLMPYEKAQYWQEVLDT
jgi:DNA-directed RNA polymerase alpha subunit